MWKVFAIVCILVQDPMGIERQDCQLFHETKDNRFETEELCLIQAEKKAEEMFYGFTTYNIPFEAMQFGCDQESQTQEN